MPPLNLPVYTCGWIYAYIRGPNLQQKDQRSAAFDRAKFRMGFPIGNDRGWEKKTLPIRKKSAILCLQPRPRSNGLNRSRFNQPRPSSNVSMRNNHQHSHTICNVCLWFRPQQSRLMSTVAMRPYFQLLGSETMP